MTEPRAGVISASLIILILVAAVVGAVVALVLNEMVGPRLLAIVSGLVAAIVASIARYRLVFRSAGAGHDESRIPGVLLVNVAIASVAGSLAAHDVATYADVLEPVVMGALAGLFSAILMALLMITFHSNANLRS